MKCELIKFYNKENINHYYCIRHKHVYTSNNPCKKYKKRETRIIWLIRCANEFRYVHLFIAFTQNLITKKFFKQMIDKSDYIGIHES